ncbi:MAG: hypothetical protein R8P61_37570 [Bacteroidia bacterium]|nr:hypothetical protein [Bacteroidia bacterium]
MTFRHYLILISLLFVGSFCFAQEHDKSEKTHQAEGAWEIVFSGLHFFQPGSEAAEERLWGNELHLTYWFNHHWALGVGYTLKYEEAGELGHELALIGSYKPAKWITFNAGPNFTLGNEEESLTVSAYIESEINIFIGNHFHLGPVIGGLLGEHAEMFSGIHLGYEF